MAWRGRSRFLEQLFRRGAVVLRPLHVVFDPGDFNLQRLDPRLQLLDRHRVEVLLGERDERVVGLAREKLFQIHSWNR